MNDAPIDEYGLIGQPKYDHLKELHKAVKLCEKTLVSADATMTSLGTYKQAHVFSSLEGCAAFLSNYNIKSSARVTFNNMQYDLPPWSISILPDCKNVAFNTAMVGVKASEAQMSPTNVKMHSWGTFNEDVLSSDTDSEITFIGLLEHLNITRDTSDYLWYKTSVNMSPSESFLHHGQNPTLSVQSAGHALHVFCNGHLSDPELTEYPAAEMLRFIKVALFCTQADSNRRPSMKQVLEMLSKEVNLNEKLLTKAGVYRRYTSQQHTGGGLTKGKKQSDPSVSSNHLDNFQSVTTILPR